MSFLNRFLDGKPQDDTMRSVLRNLNYLLNAKAGYGSPLCGFGLSDYYGQHGKLAAAQAIMRELLADIIRYEPRLRAIDLEILKDGELPLMFAMRADLAVEKGRTPTPQVEVTHCHFGILFDPIHGAVRVEELEAPRVR